MRSALAATNVVAALIDAGEGAPPARSVALGSARKGEASTDVALCLSAAVGAAGHQTILVDADPMQRLTIDLGLQGLRGVSDLLAQQSSAARGAVAPGDQVMLGAGPDRGIDNGEVSAAGMRQATSLPGVTIVPAGREPIQHVEHVAKILHVLLREADRVVLLIGCPGEHPTAVQWARASDRSLLVATSGRTKREEISRVASSARLAGVELAGTLLRVTR